MINGKHLQKDLIKNFIWDKFTANKYLITDVCYLAIIYCIFIAKGHIAESVCGGYTSYGKVSSKKR